MKELYGHMLSHMRCVLDGNGLYKLLQKALTVASSFKVSRKCD